jgi:hypothetical protein
MGKLHVELAADGVGLTGDGIIHLHAFSYVQTDQVYCPMFTMDMNTSVEISGLLDDTRQLRLSLKYPPPTLHTGGGGICIVGGFPVPGLLIPDLGVGYDAIKTLLGSPLYLQSAGGQPTPVTFSQAVLTQLAGSGVLLKRIVRIYE